AQRSERLDALERDSHIVSTSAGDIEVVTAGPEDAPAVIVLHGTPGGCDQALAIGKAFATDDHFIVAPSRPGYLRTPFVNGFLFAEQADAMVALLDSLKIPDAAVVGYGAGAVVAAEMAIRHPGRIRGLVLISPPTVPLPSVASGMFSGINFLGAKVMSDVGGDLGAFLLVQGWDKNPLEATAEVLSLDTNADDVNSAAAFIVNDPEQRDLMHAMVKSIYPLSPRETGARNDLLHLRHPQPIDFASINCPVLVLSGAKDHAREVVNPDLILDSVPDAKSEVVAGAGSMVWFGPSASGVKEKIREFLQNLQPPLPAE
ncbi:MAG: alpha/beta fold hydrolase, partial [Chthoniobacterales bacterium]